MVFGDVCGGASDFNNDEGKVQTNLVRLYILLVFAHTERATDRERERESNKQAKIKKKYI